MTRRRKQKHIWIIFDQRAEALPTDDCAVLVTCDSEREAREYQRDHFPLGVVFVYDMDRDGIGATNERRAW